jgi:hypothetical protein
MGGGAMCIKGLQAATVKALNTKDYSNGTDRGNAKIQRAGTFLLNR